MSALLDELRAALRAAEAVRDDARAQCQRLLDEKRDLVAKLVESDEVVRRNVEIALEQSHTSEALDRRLSAVQLGNSEMRREMEAEIASLRSELAARTVDAERRTQSDRSALLRMAGNVAGGLVTQLALFHAEQGAGADRGVARRAIAIARAIMAEVDKP
jgi:hypothetical protein